MERDTTILLRDTKVFFKNSDDREGVEAEWI